MSVIYDSDCHHKLTNIQVSFWIVPAIAVINTGVATQLGDPTAGVWYTSLYTVCNAIAFMICGANSGMLVIKVKIKSMSDAEFSDLFGRRWFLIGGNVLLTIGHIMCGVAKDNTTMIAGFAIIGFGAGNAQLAAFAVPELLPNKWRHIAITIADLGIWVAVVVGGIAGRYAFANGEAWRWLFHAPAIGAGISVIALFLLYYPPAHPRGLDFKRAMKELDYIGGVMFVLAATLILIGIVYTEILPSSNPKVPLQLQIVLNNADLKPLGYQSPVRRICCTDHFRPLRALRQSEAATHSYS